MKNLTSSIFTFEDLIQGDFQYVDKTEYIWQLIKPTKEMIFLSRHGNFNPRGLRLRGQVGVLLQARQVQKANLLQGTSK